MFLMSVVSFMQTMFQTGIHLCSFHRWIPFITPLDRSNAFVNNARSSLMGLPRSRSVSTAGPPVPKPAAARCVDRSGPAVPKVAVGATAPDESSWWWTCGEGSHPFSSSQLPSSHPKHFSDFGQRLAGKLKNHTSTGRSPCAMTHSQL